MLRILAVIFLLSLSACAVMDLSTLDTAVPVAPAKVQVAPYQAIGLDMTSVVNNESNDDAYADFDIASGFKANVSLRDDMDLQLRGYVGTSDTHGFKLGIKQLVHREGGHYLALVPALNWVSENPLNHTKPRHKAIGAELQMLNTITSGVTSLTLVLRGNYSKLMIDRRDSVSSEGTDYHEYDIYHGGVRANICLKGKHIYMIPELGFDIVPVINGKQSMVPVIGWTIGVEL